jgi:hypothetical protein
MAVGVARAPRSAARASESSREDGHSALNRSGSNGESTEGRDGSPRIAPREGDTYDHDFETIARTPGQPVRMIGPRQ